MKTDTVAPQDEADHALGLEIIRVLGLKRKRSNGRIETTHGDKNPCGLARTLRHLSASPLEKEAGNLRDFLVWAVEELESTRGSMSRKPFTTRARAAIEVTKQ